MTDYIAASLTRPVTPLLSGPAGVPLRCQTCGNANQTKFLTVTNLAGTVLRGFVCADCEERAKAGEYPGKRDAR